MFDVSGKKVIVTGGTRGLGLGMAEGFLKAGSEVAIVGTSDKVFEVAKNFCDQGIAATVSRAIWASARSATACSMSAWKSWAAIWTFC